MPWLAWKKGVNAFFVLFLWGGGAVRNKHQYNFTARLSGSVWKSGWCSCKWSSFAMFPRLVLAYWRRTHLTWSSAAWSPLSTSADPQKGRSPSSTPPASSAMSQTWQHHSSTINISIIVQCLKSGFCWVRKDTLDWGLVRAVGGSGNTSNVHQGTLSTLSLSHLQHHHQDHWQNWTPPEYLFDPA